MDIIFFAGNPQQDANQVHSPLHEQQEDAGGLDSDVQEEQDADGLNSSVQEEASINADQVHSAVLEAAASGLDSSVWDEQDADGLNSYVQEEASITTSKSMIKPAISHVVTG